jgi:xanthine dehydrogenase YagR molybdenum-binding subunit
MPSIGVPTSRVDGVAKVTGAAKYAGEFKARDLAYGAVVTATIARGRIKRIDAREALSVAGVIDVLYHSHRPSLADKDEDYKDDVAPDGAPFRPLYDDNIQFSGQPVALALAEDWETARFAASLVRVDYEGDGHATDLEIERGRASLVEISRKSRGDFDAAFSGAQTRLEVDYSIPVEHHNPMELFASTVIWEADGRLTVCDKTQGVQNVQRYLCGVLGLEADRLRVISPFVGGAFGSGLRPQYPAVLAALGARALRRSVRVVLTRRQMYALGYRPATIESLALGASADGELAAISQQAVAMTSQHEAYARNDTTWSGMLYKCANAKYAHRLVRLDLPTPCDMRAPGAASGVFALECAMDELAFALGVDPLELRLRLYSDEDQNQGLPYTSKALRDCYVQGAEAFGWSARVAAPRSMRDGKELVGWGMASGVWEALQMETAARVALSANGGAEVACATSDIGTGTYTIMAQVAADLLGLPLENVTVRLGDSSLPQSPVEGGSWIAASVSQAIARAAHEIRKELLRTAKTMPGSPLAASKPEDVILSEGKIVDKARQNCAVSIVDALRHGGLERIEQESFTEFAKDDLHARNTHSAVFAEVKIDAELGVIRVTRVVDAVAAGRILNPKTARSQILGGVIWGMGMALHEETLLDHNLGRFVNADIAEYHVPVNADAPDIKVIFVDEPDPTINALGVKGVGEIGIVGVAAAIANAICHATGIRVRELPITLDKLLQRL